MTLVLDEFLCGEVVLISTCSSTSGAAESLRRWPSEQRSQHRRHISSGKTSNSSVLLEVGGDIAKAK